MSIWWAGVSRGPTRQPLLPEIENNDRTSLPTRARTRRCLTSSAQSAHRHTSTRSQLIWRRDSARMSRYAGCLHATIAPAPEKFAPPWVRMHRQAYISGKRSPGRNTASVLGRAILPHCGPPLHTLYLAKGPGVRGGAPEEDFAPKMSFSTQKDVPH